MAGIAVNQSKEPLYLQKEVPFHTDKETNKKEIQLTKMEETPKEEDEKLISISNKDQIFQNIDEAIFKTYDQETRVKKKGPKPPAVEYLFVEPYGSFRIFGKWGFGVNPYGHAAVRYTMPNSSEQKVVNISGTQSDNLVTFYTPEEYVFENIDKVDQGGIWNRNIVSVRIEDLEPWQIEDMDYYFRKLYRRNKKQFSAKFSIIFSPFYNILRWLGNLSNIAERGNCAYFTSKGLAEACIVNFPTLWPKKIWIEAFEKEKARDPSNVHVVYYRRNPNQVGLKYGVDVQYLPFTGVAPLSPIRSLLYRDLQRFADVIVEVPKGSFEAEINLPEKEPLQGSQLRYYSGTILFSILALGIIASSRGRKKVKKTVDATQDNAKELVRLFRQHRKQKIGKSK